MRGMMRASSPVLALLLVLAILMALPSIVTLPRVYGATQSGNTSWSPFGPQEQTLIFSVYADYQSMFNAFKAGMLDITDLPILPGTSSSWCNSSTNPDFYCTSPTPEVLLYDLVINSHGAIMGVPLTSPRTTSPATVTVGSSSTACSAGFGSLTITLENQETSNSIIKDHYNSVKVANQPSGSPSATVSDSGGSSPNGIYRIPCILAGSYLLSSSAYIGSAVTTISSGLNTAVTFHVNWNSISNVNLTPARAFWGAAVAHLVDMPSFVNSFYGSAAVYDNTFDPGAVLGPPTLAQLTAADCFLHGNLTGPDVHPWAPQCSSYPSGGNDVSAYNVAADNVTGGTLWWQITGMNVVLNNGYSGHQDLRAACDDLVSMGLSLSSAAGVGGCENVANALANSTLPSPWTTTNYPHVMPNGNIILYPRSDAARKQLSTILGDTLNAIFGSPSTSGGSTVCYGNTVIGNQTSGCVTAPKFYTIGQIASTIFADGPVSAGGTGPNGWNLYPSTIDEFSPGDILYASNSVFSGGNCYAPGGNNPPLQAEPDNYWNYCDPQLDTMTTEGEFSPAPNSGTILFQAAIEAMSNTINVPGWTPVTQNVELNGWNYQQCTGTSCAETQSSIVNTIGGGTEIPFWTLLNARQVPGYTPVNSSFAPGGGNPNVIRMGSFEPLSQLSPFLAPPGFDDGMVTSEVFDSMLQVNPLTYARSGQLLDWQTTSHTVSFNPTASCSSPYTGPVVGCTTQIWHLRNDLMFQDGNPVTANDVAYSILAERDVPDTNYPAYDVVSAQGLDCGMGQPCKTLQVVVTLQSPFDELSIGTAPILEQALWQPYCGAVTGPGGYAGNGIPNAYTSQCANYNFDPMTANNPLTNTPGIFVGDGPFSCIVPAGFPNAGHVGGSCTETGSNTLVGQEVGPGGHVILTRNQLYFRCCPGGPGAFSSSLYKISYADVNNDGIVNIEDLASVAACFGITAGSHGPLCTAAQSSYWVNANIAPGSSVNISDLATVAYYFGAGLTSYNGSSNLSSLTGIDPQIDPFNCPITGC